MAEHAFALKREGDPQRKLGLADPGPAPLDLAEKFRPRSFDEMVGQDLAVAQLEGFVRAPYTTAFLFEGETGCGKTTAALILASALGCGEKIPGMPWGNWTGLKIIESGKQDAEEVEQVLRDIRLTPFGTGGSGWKLVLVDEADYMSTKAANMWLSALESLPPKRVIVFTTNHPEKFPERFRDRCQRILFESSAQEHRADAQTLIGRLWQRETGLDPSTAPSLQQVNRSDASGLVINDSHQLSYRRAVRALEPWLRLHAKQEQGVPPAPQPTLRKVEPEPAKLLIKAISLPEPEVSNLVADNARGFIKGWKTPYRGRLALYSKDRKAVVGTATLIACEPCGEPTRYHWRVECPQPCVPYPCPTRAGGFFDVDPTLLRPREEVPA